MDIQLPQIIFQMINFGVVVGLLTYLLYRPILDILKERSQKIEQAQKAAEKTLAEQDKLEAYKKDVKKQAEKQAADIIAEAQDTAEKQRKQIVQKAKEEAKDIVAKAQEQWAEQEAKLARSMKEEFADAVLAVTKKVLGKSLDTKAHEKVIDQEIETMMKAA